MKGEVSGMEENKAENKIAANEKTPTAAPQKERAGGEEKLKALAKNIKEAEKEGELRRRELEKSISEQKALAERKISEKKAELEKDSARIEKIANEHRQKLEYSTEYRKSIRKRADKFARENSEKENEEQRAEREKKISEEREAYLQRERELSEARKRKNDKIMSLLGFGETGGEEKKEEAEPQKNEKPENIPAPELEKNEEKLKEKTEERAEEKAEEKVRKQPSQSDDSAASSESNKAFENKEKSSTGVSISEENGKLMLNFNRAPEKKTTGKVECGEDNVLRFGGIVSAVPGMQKDKKSEFAGFGTGKKPMLIGGKYMPAIIRDEVTEDYKEYYPDPEYIPEDAGFYEKNYSARAEEREIADFEKHNDSEKTRNDAEEARLIAEFEESLENEKKGGDALFGKTLVGEDSEYPHSDILAFTKNELTRRLNKNHREQQKLLKKIKNSEKAQRSSVSGDNVHFIVEKIGYQKEIVEIASESLTFAVYASDKARMQRCKKELVAEIENYNQLCDEYEKSSGKTLQYISSDRADDIMAGIVTKPIPNVFYINESPLVRETAESRQAPKYEADTLWDLELSDKEYDIVIGREVSVPERRKNKRLLQKEREAKVNSVKSAVERDLTLIGLRYEHKIRALEAKRDLIYHSFTVNQKRKDKALNAIEKKINKQKRLSKRAVRLERDDNTRYYSLLLLDAENEKIKDGANRERLAALRMRLDILLSERQVVNDELIALYGGTDKKLTYAKINRKAASVRRKRAKAAARSQRQLAEKMKKYRAPDEMKEKSLSLLNEKTAAIAEIEETKYKINALRPRGKALKEMYRKIKAEKKKIRRINDDIKFVLKKLRRHEARFIDDMQWAMLLISIAVIAIAAIGAYTFFGEEIKAFLLDFYNRFIVNK